MSPTIKGRGARSTPARDVRAFACANAGGFATPDDRNRWGKRCARQCPSCVIWSHPRKVYIQEPGGGGHYVIPD